MPVRYGFIAKGKILLYAAGIICIISIFLLPFGIVFIYMAHAAHITIDDRNFTYRMLRKRVIPFEQITGIMVGKRQQPAYYVDGYGRVSFASVIPLKLEYGGGKGVKLSLNFFEWPERILATLRGRTGLEVIDEHGDTVPFQE